jgi:N4-gp56 family major capsid protein
MSGQLWSVNSLGGFLSANKLSKKLRAEVTATTKFRQFADVKDATQQGMHKGATFTWDVYSMLATEGTTLVETNTMNETNFTITQGTLTVNEYGNSVPYTGKLDNLSELPVTTMIRDVLKDDTAKTLDTAAHAQFNTTPLRVVPTGGTDTSAVTLTTNGTATLTNTIAFGKNHAKSVVDLMSERNIPRYKADDYVAIAWRTTYRTLRDDLESVYQYTTEGLDMVMRGEIGKFENIRYVEQTHIAKSGWSTGNSDWIFFLGADTVAEGINTPEEVRGKIPGDYGRSKGIAWYYLGGFGLVRTTASDARVVKWDSAA